MDFRICGARDTNDLLKYVRTYVRGILPDVLRDFL